MKTRKHKKWKSEPDAVLLKMASSETAAVLGELFLRYRVLCFGLCLRYLKDREKARDAVSEIFLRLRSDLKNHEIQHFRSWFYSYSKNYCLGVIRKSETREKHEKNWWLDSIEAPGISPPEEGQLAELRKAFEHLKPHQKQCLQLFYFQKRSYAEIAEDLSISEKKVKSHLQNGKRKLGLILKTRLHPAT